MSEGGDIKIKGKVGADGAEGDVQLSNVEKLVKYLWPGRYAHAQINAGLAHSIRAKLEAGSGDFTPLERNLLIQETLGDTARKLENKAAIVEAAMLIDPELGIYLDGNLKALPPGKPGEKPPDPPNSQFFWDRFWTDAEAVSDEYMRGMYARVLAFSARSPMNLKTIDVLRTLDGELLEHFHQALRHWASPMIFDVEDDAFGKMLLFESYGLVLGRARFHRPDNGAVLNASGVLLRTKGMSELFGWPLSPAGQDIERLAPKRAPSYELFEYLTDQGNVDIGIADGRWQPFDWSLVPAESRTPTEKS